MPHMKSLSHQQRLHLINTEQLYENYVEALGHSKSFRYGLRWKTVRNTAYLFRPHNRSGDGKSLGKRSPETENVYAEFHAGKIRADERKALIELSLSEQARLNKALRLARMPILIADILRELSSSEAMDDFTVIGTQSLFAYETIGGAHFLLELLASGDIDLLYNHRQRLAITSKKLNGEGLIGLLQRVDKTFSPMRTRGFRAANAGQFMVDLIVPPIDCRLPEIQFSPNDLIASEVPGLEWLLNSPKIETIAIDEHGQPAPIRTVDPRAFAIHKLWLSQLPNRDPIKKPRDAAQAKAVAQLVQDALPHLPFEQEHLRFFPRDIAVSGLGIIQSP